MSIEPFPFLGEPDSGEPDSADFEAWWRDLGKPSENPYGKIFCPACGHRAVKHCSNCDWVVCIADIPVGIGQVKDNNTRQGCGYGLADGSRWYSWPEAERRHR